MSQNSLAANARRFLDASSQKSTEDFLMHVLDHVRVERLVFHMTMSENCAVVETTAHARHEDICRVIAERLDRARSLPLFGANEYPAVGCSSGTSGDHGDSRGSSDAGASSSKCHVVS